MAEFIDDSGNGVGFPAIGDESIDDINGLEPVWEVTGTTSTAGELFMLDRLEALQQVLGTNKIGTFARCLKSPQDEDTTG